MKQCLVFPAVSIRECRCHLYSFIYLFLEFDPVFVVYVLSELVCMQLWLRSGFAASLVRRRVHNLIQLLVHYLLLCSPFTECPRTPAILMTCSVLHCFMLYLSFLLKAHNVFMIFSWSVARRLSEVNPAIIIMLSMCKCVMGGGHAFPLFSICFLHNDAGCYF